MSSSPTPDYESFSLDYGNETETKQYQQQIRMMYIIAYCIILFLGLTLNFTFLLVGSWKYRSFKKVIIWILALAITHLASCVSVVFQLLYAYHEFEWHYGTASCKLSSYITYGSMYSTAAMLSLWSISAPLSKSACMKKCKNFNIILILFSWSLAAVLALPSMLSREIRLNQCIDDYDLDKTKTTPYGIERLKAVVAMRFLFGLVIPALVMFIGCCVASKSSHNRCEDCKKQAQIICAIKIAYFVCWGPQIFLVLLQATSGQSVDPDTFKYGLPAATVLATAHCFPCPLIYILVGRCFNMNWMVHNPEHIDGEIY